MDRPGVKNTTAAELPRADETAAAFFPDFATVSAALEAGQIGVWSWDIATNMVTWSSNVETIHGLTSGTFDNTYAFFERDIHKDDRERVVEALNEALRTGRPYWVRYRAAPRENREECWIEASGAVIFEDGAAVRMVGICHDITERIKI